MRYGGFRVVAALVLIGLVAALTGGAFAAGFSAGAGTNATGVSPWVYGGAFGVSHILGFFIAILVLVLILRLLFGGAVARRRRYWGGPAWAYRHHRHYGYWGNTQPDDWQRGPWHDPRQEAFDYWHQRAHETGATGTPETSAAPGPSGSDSAAR